MYRTSSETEERLLPVASAASSSGLAFAASASASAWAFASASAFRLAMAALVACNHCDWLRRSQRNHRKSPNKRFLMIVYMICIEMYQENITK